MELRLRIVGLVTGGVACIAAVVVGCTFLRLHGYMGSYERAYKIVGLEGSGCRNRSTSSIGLTAELQSSLADPVLVL